MGRQYEQLSLEEREEIARLQAQGASIRQIAAALDRQPSPIARKLKRNSSNKVGYQPTYPAPHGRKAASKTLSDDCDDTYLAKLTSASRQEKRSTPSSQHTTHQENASASKLQPKLSSRRTSNANPHPGMTKAMNSEHPALSYIAVSLINSRQALSHRRIKHDLISDRIRTTQ